MRSVVQGQLVAQSVLALPKPVDPSSDRRYMLAAVKVKALDDRGVALSAKRGQHLIDGLDRAKHHAVFHLSQGSAPPGFDHLGVEPLGQRHPAVF